MDWSHFGMDGRPFRAAVDLSAYFPAAAHEAARSELSAAFDRGDSLALLDGPPGCGKTLTAMRWLADLPPDTPRVVLPNSHVGGAVELLQAILFDLEQPYQGLSEQELRLAVTGELLKGLAAGHTTALVVDEAHHLSPVALEELRQLGNIEGRGRKALFTLLVALPPLRKSLTRAAAEGFAQRLAVRCAIDPLTAEESAAYLRHHVAEAGGDPDAVFESDAVDLLAGACRGVPRLLNQAAGMAVDLAAAGEAEAVDVEAAMGALERLGLSAAESAEPEPPAHPLPAVGGKAGRPESAGKPGEPAAAARPKQKPVRKRSA